MKVAGIFMREGKKGGVRYGCKTAALQQRAEAHGIVIANYRAAEKWCREQGSSRNRYLRQFRDSNRWSLQK